MKAVPDLNVCIQYTNVGVSMLIYKVISEKNELHIDELYNLISKSYALVEKEIKLSFIDFYESLILLYALDKIDINENEKIVIKGVNI